VEIKVLNVTKYGGEQKLLWRIHIKEFTTLSGCFMRKVKKDRHFNEINKNFTNNGRVDQSNMNISEIGGMR
jgi:hypothetical protein